MSEHSLFTLDRGALVVSGRVVCGEWTTRWLDQVEAHLNDVARITGFIPVQRGRVIAVRQTDAHRAYSAFKTSLYHSRYDDMLDGDRFFRSLQPAHNSYEPFRGETILFLFLYVGKGVYDGLSMFTYGRPTRIAGGSRHSVPWGVEVAPELPNRDDFVERNMCLMRRIAELDAKGGARSDAESAELETLRCELPACHCMAPFIMEFSEEALMTKVFKQRLWERGVEHRDTAVIAADMWECCKALDPGKFQAFYDYHGPHTVTWEDGMRELRESGVTLDGFVEALQEGQAGSEDAPTAYEALMAYFESRR